MSEDTRYGDLPHLSAAALREWSRTVESVMRGVAHALNNRAAALSAVIELSLDPEDADTTITGSILSSELTRVSELAQVVRSLGTPRSGMEAFAPRDAVAEALAILRLHADQHERVVSLDASSAQPIRVPRWMFVRSLIALGASAPGGAGQVTHVQIVIREDGEDWVAVRVDGVRGVTAEVSPYAAEVAKAMGGDVLGEGLGFRLPSLAALRRREAR
jgi:hypothetical protein